MNVLHKLLQIYRKRDVFDHDFEARIFFEYLRIDSDEEEMKLLFKTCWKFNEKFTVLDKVCTNRIAFQLDLEKNKVPIESSGMNKQSKSS